MKQYQSGFKIIGVSMRISKVFCIYHKNCFDGMASAWVVNRAYEGKAKLIPMQYGESIQQIYKDNGIDQDSEVIFVDVSCKRADMIWASGVAHILVIDHHKTAEK